MSVFDRWHYQEDILALIRLASDDKRTINQVGENERG